MTDSGHDIDALLLRACAGDETALERVLVHATPRLRAHVEHEIQPRWRSHVTVEDILQETYIDVCASITRFRPEGENAFERWVKRIARNNIADAIRAISHPGPENGQRAPRHLTGFGPHLTLLKTIVGTSPSLSVMRPMTEMEAREFLRQYLASLLEHERLVIGQLFFDGRSAAQIGADLGKTIGAVYLIRNRAIRKLRGMFGIDATNSGCPA